MWSFNCISSVQRACFMSSVVCRSARLGMSVPAGWLCASITFAAVQPTATVVIMRLSHMLLLVPPMLTLYQPSSLSALFRHNISSSSRHSIVCISIICLSTCIAWQVVVMMGGGSFLFFPYLYFTVIMILGYGK